MIIASSMVENEQERERGIKRGKEQRGRKNPKLVKIKQAKREKKRSRANILVRTV